MSRTNKFGLSIDDRLYAFLTEDVLPGTGLNSEAFFEGFSAIVHELSPKNRELLAKRDALQENRRLVPRERCPLGFRCI